jgi:hypothetical protein
LVVTAIGYRPKSVPAYACSVPLFLDRHFGHVAIAVDSAPEIKMCAMDRDDHLVKITATIPADAGSDTDYGRSPSRISRRICGQSHSSPRAANSSSTSQSLKVKSR